MLFLLKRTITFTPISGSALKKLQAQVNVINRKIRKETAIQSA